MTPELEDKIARLPASPGVYIMRGPKNEIIYIGKATRLKDRVRSYFSGTDSRPFVPFLSDLLTDLEYVVTSNAKEALLLENTLIKKHRPRFNIKLVDDKNYLAIRLDLDHEWPRVELVRRIRDDGAKYFGPYHSASKVRETLNVLNRHFQLRTCRDSILHNRTRPCLQYQIKRCPAPCVLPISRDEYMQSVKESMLFLAGRESELAQTLARRMEAAAEELRFEDAARVRDQLTAVRESLERQGAVQTVQVDQDVIGLYREGESASLALMIFREGSLRDIRSFGFQDQMLPDDELLLSFIGRFYQATDNVPPEQILVPVELEDAAIWEDALTELRQRKVEILQPMRGEKRRLLQLARENAQAHFQQSMSTTAEVDRILEKVRERLDLPKTPRTVECYDISNFQGAFITASQVVFQDGVPDKARYRQLRIRSRDTQDDFASIFEVIARRARRARQGESPMPDLIVIDGGKGQLASAVEALRSERVTDQLIVSLAKARTLDASEPSDEVEHSDERVFIPGRKNPVILKKNTAERHFFERIRDEAHRVAIGFHRKLRNTRTLRSALDDVRGVGASRRKALLLHFGSVRKIRDATLEELEAVDGLGRNVALAVFAHFHPGEADVPAPPDPSDPDTH